MVITNNTSDAIITEKKAKKYFEATINLTAEPYNMTSAETIGTPTLNTPDWEAMKYIVLNATFSFTMTIPIMEGESQTRSIEVTADFTCKQIDMNLNFEVGNTATLTASASKEAKLFKIVALNYVYEYETNWDAPLVFQYTTNEQNAFEKANYSEKPELVFSFCKRPILDYSHFQYFDELIARAKKLDKNYQDGIYVTSITKMERYLYPLFLRTTIDLDLVNFNYGRKWTNLFCSNSQYLWENNNGNVFMLFIINDNDCVMTYLQAFSELYRYIDLTTTRATFESLNQALYEYINFDDIITNLSNIGTARDTNIFDRVNSKYVTSPTN